MTRTRLRFSGLLPTRQSLTSVKQCGFSVHPILAEQLVQQHFLASGVRELCSVTLWSLANFMLYEVEAEDGSFKSSFAAAHVKPGSTSPAKVWCSQWDYPMPSDWVNKATPLTPRRKRRRY
eukprot:scpid92727/ scgid34532/ 